MHKQKMEKRIPSLVSSMHELKKIIKQEGLGAGRLTSLRLPRDLSLGGTKPKKVYTPNLNVVRNKDKNKFMPIRTDGGQKRGAKNFSPNDLSRQRNKRAKLVQSAGVFSQGMGEYKQRHSSMHERSEGTQLTMPKFDKNAIVNKGADNVLVKELIADEESDSEPDGEFEPIVLPLSRNKEEFENVFKVKDEDIIDKIKKEPDYDGKMKVAEHIIDLLTSVQNRSEPSSSYVNAFVDTTKIYDDDDNPTVSLIQLPTSFAKKVYTDDPKEKNLDCKLTHLHEGQIGKILVHKSGKMDVMMHGIKYSLNSYPTGEASGSVVLFPGDQSIAMDPTVVNLGTLNETTMLTPDWDALFEQARRTRKFYW